MGNIVTLPRNTLVITKNDAAYTTFSEAIPIDNTIPQITEGTQLFSQAITTTHPSSSVWLQAYVQGATDTAFAYLILAAFRDSISDSIGASVLRLTTVDLNQIFLNILDTPGAVGTYTYTVRLGISSGNFSINGNTSARFLGGASQCFLSLQEIIPTT